MSTRQPIPPVTTKSLLQNFITSQSRSPLSPKNPYTVKDNLVDFTDANGMDINNESAIIYVWYMFIKTLELKRLMVITDLKYSATVADVNAEGESDIIKSHLNKLRDGFTAAVPYLLDLSACHQIRELNAGNLAGYFAGINLHQIVGNLIARSLNYFSSKLPMIMKDAELRSIIPDLIFIKYHTSFASTPQLVKKMFDSVPELTASYVSEETKSLVNIAIENHWDLQAVYKIPLNVVMMTYCFLDVNDALPDNWYQGRRAFESIGSGQKWKAIFRRIKSLRLLKLISSTTNLTLLRFSISSNLLRLCRSDQAV